MNRSEEEEEEEEEEGDGKEELLPVETTGIFWIDFNHGVFWCLDTLPSRCYAARSLNPWYWAG